MNDYTMTPEITAWYEQLRQNEKQWLQIHQSGESPRGLAWEYKACLGNNPEQCFQKIMDLIALLLEVPQHDWPSIEQWRGILPNWFLINTPSHTRVESDELLSSIPEEAWGDLPWDLQSWLDTIHIREWHWWSYRRYEGNIVIYLELSGWPAHLGAFEYILRVSDAILIDSRMV